MHPIQLVVFEQKMMGAVGATLYELYEAVDLVERGVVRTIVDRALPLEQLGSGLNTLERGELVGPSSKAEAYMFRFTPGIPGTYGHGSIYLGYWE